MDAPIDMPPGDILKRVIDMAVTMATDPAISDPAPSTDICQNCAGQGWEPSVYKGKVPCSFCQPAPSTAGELTLEQITRIYDRYGGDMVNCTRAIERELAAARSQPTTEESSVVAGAQPVREPLTDSWILERCAQSWVFETAKQWVRMTEAAHGITQGGKV